MGLLIQHPGRDQNASVGSTVHVGGYATGNGFPEPTVIESVKVWIDTEQSIDATLKRLPTPHPIPKDWVPTWLFGADIIVPGPAGVHAVWAKAIDDSDALAGLMEVDIVAGGVTFDGSGTLRTSCPYARGPFEFDVHVGAVFSDDRLTLTIVSFPPIDSGEFNIPVLGTDDVTVTLVGGGTGMFDPNSGNMSIPIKPNFHHSITVLGKPVFSDSTLEVVLTTGAESSPHGTFSDQGQPLQPDGSIRLIGDGGLQGGPLGGYDASLVLDGTISPHP